MRQCLNCLSPLDLKDPETVIRDNGSKHDCFCDSECVEEFDRKHRPEVKGGNKWWLALAAAAIVAGVCFKAWGAPPENTPLLYPEWFKGQMRPTTGTSCCDISDGHIVDWNFKGDHYVAYFEGAWRDIPPDAVLQNSRNPTGNGVVWYNKAGGGINIFCFAPSTGA